MADTPFPRLSKSLFQVVQTWLHHRGAAIEVALTCPVLESQKAEFTELLMAEGRQISAFIMAYPNSNNLSIDPSHAKLILQCQASQSALTVLTSLSDSLWAEKPKAWPSDVSHVPLPATQQWWRPFHEATRKQVFLSPMAVSYTTIPTRFTPRWLPRSPNETHSSGTWNLGNCTGKPAGILRLTCTLTRELPVPKGIQGYGFYQGSDGPSTPPPRLSGRPVNPVGPLHMAE
ncbi:hypothetical protein BDN67DRAFT_984791 [Paxillus ammoniavirescens]|nr:hypothetical protein BDN67DRAFT_984791 [Paxillus ammoniavirescens]